MKFLLEFYTGYLQYFIESTQINMGIRQFLGYSILGTTLKTPEIYEKITKFGFQPSIFILFY